MIQDGAIANLMEVRFPLFLKSIRFGLTDNNAIETIKGLTWLKQKINANQINPFPVMSKATVQFIPKHPSHCVRPENSPLIFYITPVRDTPPGNFQVQRLPCLFIQIREAFSKSIKLDFLVLGSSSYDTQSHAKTLLWALSPQNHHAISTKLNVKVQQLGALESGRFRDDVFYTRTTAELELIDRQVTPEELELPLLFFGKKKQILLGKNIRLPGLSVIQGRLAQLLIPAYSLTTEQPIWIPLRVFGVIQLATQSTAITLTHSAELALHLMDGYLQPAESISLSSSSPAMINLEASGEVNIIPPILLQNRRNPILAPQLRVAGSGFLGSHLVVLLLPNRMAYLPSPYAVWQITPIPVQELPSSTTPKNTYPLMGGRQITVGDRQLTVFTVKSDWGHLRFQIVSVSQIQPPYYQRFNYQTCKFPPDYYQVILPGIVEDGIYQATIYEQQNQS